MDKVENTRFLELYIDNYLSYIVSTINSGIYPLKRLCYLYNITVLEMKLYYE